MPCRLRGVPALKLWRRDERRENQAEARATDRAAQRQTRVDPEPRQKEEAAGEEVGTKVEGARLLLGRPSHPHAHRHKDVRGRGILRGIPASTVGCLLRWVKI